MAAEQWLCISRTRSRRKCVATTLLDGMSEREITFGYTAAVAVINNHHHQPGHGILHLHFAWFPVKMEAIYSPPTIQSPYHFWINILRYIQSESIISRVPHRLTRIWFASHHCRSHQTFVFPLRHRHFILIFRPWRWSVSDFNFHFNFIFRSWFFLSLRFFVRFAIVFGF